MKGGSIATGGLFNTTLRGTGWVALTTDGPPVVLNAAEAPTFADTNAVVAWSANLQTQLKTSFKAGALIGRGSGEAVQVSFYGHGFVIVQPCGGCLSLRWRPSRTSQLEQHRHRTVVDEFDLHVRAEDTGLHICAQSSQRVGERGHQRLGDGAGRRGVPRGSSPLGGVGVQRELTDHQDGRSDVACGLLVIENAQLPELFGKALGLEHSSSVCVTPTSASSP